MYVCMYVWVYVCMLSFQDACPAGQKAFQIRHLDLGLPSGSGTFISEQS